MPHLPYVLGSSLLVLHLSIQTASLLDQITLGPEGGTEAARLAVNVKRRLPR